MKIIIKNPAPQNDRLSKWGDYHYGKSLEKYLARMGIEVKTHYKHEWYSKEKSDAVIALQGRYHYIPSGNAKNLLWIYSHPAGVKIDELENYDIVCAASDHHAELLRNTLNRPVFTLLQCTDLEMFPLPDISRRRNGIVFVGNTRGIPRPCVKWAVDYGVPVKLWGRGWSRYIDTKYVMGDYIDNVDLGKLYSESLFTLNDHWNDMNKLGYVNNRIYDAMACGLPIITDYHDALFQKFPEELLYFRDRKSFELCIDRISENYQSYKSMIYGINDIIRSEYSFEVRVRQIIEIINNAVNAKKHRNIRQILFGNKRSRSWGRGRNGFVSFSKFERSAKQKGKKACPICETVFQDFVTYGDNGQQCPECGSLETSRFFWVFFSNLIGRSFGKLNVSLLYIEPETCIAGKLDSIDGINYFSASVDSPHAMVQIELNDTKFPNEKFHMVIANVGLLNYINNIPAIKELHRILKKSGVALILCLQEQKLDSRINLDEFSVRIIKAEEVLSDEMCKCFGIKNQVIIECAKKEL